MERLTYWCDNGYNGGKWFVAIDAEGGEDYGPHVDRLAAYEETGLEPEDIRNQLESMLDAMALFFETTPDRLRELAQADREGRCVVLPCGPGQVVWAANSFGVSSHQIRMLVRDKDGDFACSMIKFPIEDFGRKVFLTRAEAEEALRREQE